MEEDPAPPLKGARAGYPLIILVGRNGQHKRTLVRRAVAAFPEQLVLVPTVTTRCPRDEDLEGEFIHHAPHIIDEMERGNEFIESVRRTDVDRTFYGRTLELILTALEERIGIAVMSEEGALRVRAARVICYVIRIVTLGDSPDPIAALPVAGLRVSQEIRCDQTEAGFEHALDAIKNVIERVTTGIRTTRPPALSPTS